MTIQQEIFETATLTKEEVSTLLDAKLSAMDPAALIDQLAKAVAKSSMFINEGMVKSQVSPKMVKEGLDKIKADLEAKFENANITAKQLNYELNKAVTSYTNQQLNATGNTVESLGLDHAIPSITPDELNAQLNKNGELKKRLEGMSEEEKVAARKAPQKTPEEAPEEGKKRPKKREDELWDGWIEDAKSQFNSFMASIPILGVILQALGIKFNAEIFDQVSGEVRARMPKDELEKLYDLMEKRESVASDPAASKVLDKDVIAVLSILDAIAAEKGSLSADDIMQLYPVKDRLIANDKGYDAVIEEKFPHAHKALKDISKDPEITTTTLAYNLINAHAKSMTEKENEIVDAAKGLKGFPPGEDVDENKPPRPSPNLATNDPSRTP